MRFRYVFMGFGVAAVLGALVATDPDKGLMTGMLLMALATPVLAVAFAHLARRGLFDYLDLQQVAGEAQKGPTGAGLVFVGVCIVIAALLGLFGRSVQAATVPPQAFQYLPVLSSELNRFWPDAPDRGYMGGLIEHESACPLKRSCWKPTARLKSQREEGAGLGQLTRAWRPDGSLRFDKLTEMRDQHPALRELSWSTIYQRPDLQIRTMIVMVRSDYRFFTGRGDALAFADAAYNGGRGGLEKERRACGLKAGCDPRQWFGHVEHVCLKSRKPIYGNRSACDINRKHVRDVFERAPKYRPLVRLKPEVSGVEHALQRQSAPESGVHGVVLDAEAFGPVEQVHGVVSESHQVQCLGAVGSLLLGSCPTAVIRSVALGAVDPVNRHFLRTRTHVSHEVLKHRPSLADLNATIVVMLRRGSAWYTAPGVHATPDVVSTGSGLPVPAVLPRMLEAAARLDVCASQPRCANDLDPTAVAKTGPLIGAVDVASESLNDKSAKALTRFDGVHMRSKIFDANIEIGNDVIRTRGVV